MRQHKPRSNYETPKEYIRDNARSDISDPLPPILSSGNFSYESDRVHIPRINLDHLPKGTQLFTNNRGKVIALMPMRIGYRVLNPAKLLYMDTVMEWWVIKHLKPIRRERRNRYGFKLYQA